MTTFRVQMQKDPEYARLEEQVLEVQAMILGDIARRYQAQAAELRQEDQGRLALQLREEYWLQMQPCFNHLARYLALSASPMTIVLTGDEADGGCCPCPFRGDGGCCRCRCHDD